MFRFKISKYRNAIAKIPKKEAWITDLNVSSALTHGSLIKASATFIVFHPERPGGGAVSILPLDFKGKIDRNACALQCHSDVVTDFDFSPFDDGLLATVSQDCSIKLWNIPQDGFQSHIFNPSAQFCEAQNRVENVLFHPTVDSLLSTSSHNVIRLWDVVKEKDILTFDKHDDLVQSFCWQGFGNLMASSCRDKKLRIFDPRTTAATQEATVRCNPKDSRVIWLGDVNQILSTGFQSGHERQVVLRDLRNFSSPLKTLSFDNNIGILLPFFDCDTNMLFIAGKADASITFLEVVNNDPYLSLAAKDLTEGQTKGMCLVPKRAVDVMQGEVNRLLQLTQSAIVPIRYQVPRKTYRDFHADLFPDTNGTDPGLNIQAWLNGEQCQLKKISLDPSKRNTPTLQKHRHAFDSFDKKPVEERKTSIEESQVNVILMGSPKQFIFREDNEVFPPPDSSQEIDNRQKTTNKPTILPKVKMPTTVSPVLKRSRFTEVSQNETDEAEKFPIPRRESFSSPVSNQTASNPIPVPRNSINGSDRERKLSGGSHSPKGSWVREMVAAANANSPSGDGKPSSGSPKNTIEVPARRDSLPNAPRRDSLPIATPPVKSFSGFRVSKFRHLKGTPLHKDQHIENIRNLSTSLPRECDGIQANTKRIALVFKGPGGRLSIFELNKPGRVSDGVLPVLQNTSNVMDFCWDPFNTERIAVGCDDAIIRIWLIPEDGLTESMETPTAMLKGHNEKISIIKFHPLATNILASCAHDLTVRIWNVATCEEQYLLMGHLDQMFGLDWSPNGKCLATIAKDNKIRVYEPRSSAQPITTGTGTFGNKGARIKWVLQGNFIILCGFDRISERQIKLFKVSDLNTPIVTVSLDVTPAILIPHYDEDSATLFLTGKGDSTIYTYEVLEESPHLFPLSHHKCPTVHQGLSFLPKIVCDVKVVEFARALRLNGTTIEPITFTVPRVKMDMFQNDLFPETRVLWEPTLTENEWLRGVNKEAKRLSLKPDGMENVSMDTPKSAGLISKNVDAPFMEEPSKKQLEKELVTALHKKLALSDEPEQDLMEDLDAAEWND
uniref:Coronin n=1 Tax=Strigamia maritima TaxID=126957 RepID=T1IM85_STRMM